MAKMTAVASGWNKYLAVPLKKKIGTNTMQILSVETNAGTAICMAPSRMARTIGFPMARLRWIFSSSTVASSTRIPTASARPPSVMIFSVSPSAPRTMIEHRIESGMEVATTSVLRQLPRKSRIIKAVRHAAMTPARKTPLIAEGVIAACLTALMILLFLGNWRSTLDVATSIPLSILCSIIVLGALGQTMNIMTLGGLALAVGILVDDATVELENIHRNLAIGKPMVRAILDGAMQIAVPAFVSTLSICIVFVPIFFLSGTAKYLFQPLATAFIFAMLASYLLSRTVV